MKVLIEGAEFEVSFRHVKDNVRIKEADERRSIPVGTECFIYLGANEVGYGKAELARVDYGKFCKETGRKIALGRALSTIALAAGSKTIRRQFWNAYLNRTNLTGTKYHVVE